MCAPGDALTRKRQLRQVETGLLLACVAPCPHTEAVVGTRRSTAILAAFVILIGSRLVIHNVMRTDTHQPAGRASFAPTTSVAEVQGAVVGLDSVVFLRVVDAV